MALRHWRERTFKTCVISPPSRLYLPKLASVCTRLRLRLRGDGRSPGCWSEGRTYDGTKRPGSGAFLCFHDPTKGIKTSLTMMLTFLDAVADAIGLLEEVVVVALATAVQEVFAFSRVLVVVPARERALTGPHHRGQSAGVCGGAEAPR